MRTPERGGPPERLGTEAERFLESLFRAGAARRGRAVAEAWLRAAGPVAARVVRPVRLRNGVLDLRAASPVWRDEIRMRSAEILARLRREMGEDVRELNVRLGMVVDVRSADAADPPPPAEPMPALADVAGRLESEALQRLATRLAGPPRRPRRRRGGRTGGGAPTP